jgi:hypothetical protein
MLAIEISQNIEEAVHMKRLEENVNVGGGNISAQFAQGIVDGVGEDSELIGALGFREIAYGGNEHAILIVVGDINDEKIGMLGFEQFHCMIWGDRASYIVPEFAEQAARRGILSVCIG